MKSGITVLAKSEMELSRFVSHIEAVLSTLSVQNTGEKGRKYMKSKIKYTDEPLGKLRIVDIFLPPPGDLLFKEENVKITITLSKTSVVFFKNEAKKHDTQYERIYGYGNCGTLVNTDQLMPSCFCLWDTTRLFIFFSVQIAYQLVQDYGIPLAEVIRQLGVSTSAISKAITRRTKE